MAAHRYATGGLCQSLHGWRSGVERCHYDLPDSGSPRVPARDYREGLVPAPRWLSAEGVCPSGCGFIGCPLPRSEEHLRRIGISLLSGKQQRGEAIARARVHIGFVPRVAPAQRHRILRQLPTSEPCRPPLVIPSHSASAPRGQSRFHRRPRCPYGHMQSGGALPAHACGVGIGAQSSKPSLTIPALPLAQASRRRGSAEESSSPSIHFGSG